ncbi:MAG: hypothetical protein JNK15_02265 [Planctomycetes bacterium]|nr:hypothetical protein [Planctomycetota bacterium]
MTHIAISLGLLFAGAVVAQSETKKAGYVVVVNATNPCTQTGAEAQATVKKLFLKELTQWPGGVEARPYARDGASPEHVAFVKFVLGMTDAELARHWLKMKNMSGTTPPKDVDSDRLVLKYVAKHQGAFGVVKADAAKGVEGVKVLFEF